MGNVFETEILIVGGGPAGCAAAIELARGQRDVMLIDKSEFPRDKCCGDGLTTDALRILEDMGMCSSKVSNWNNIMNVVIHSPNGNIFELPLPKGQGQ
ncbi:MAG: FAD-dependent oxidoreductase, partial [Actinomycetota bacterium]|nr:FAD-dependent oxidoreductase [Actinomycetota bacterium]